MVDKAFKPNKQVTIHAICYFVHEFIMFLFALILIYCL